MRRKSGSRILFLAVLTLGLVSAQAFAQSSIGTILGVVKDASGGVVANAKITVTNVDTTEARTDSSGEDGAYRFPALRAGHYALRVEAQGFQTETQTGLILDVAQEQVVNVTLQVGSSTQEVHVTGEAPVVDTTTSTLGSLVNDQTVSDLPLNGRNFIDLTMIQPGVQSYSHGTAAGSSGTWFSSNGAPARSNNFTLDGAPMVNQYGTGPNSISGSTLGVDGIKEYKLVTNMFGAEYGMTMGSQMVIVSKGGANQWHGDAFEYLRNNDMDARNFFELQPSALGGLRLPVFARNNFGGSAGGPIQKDKTFFYLVYEGLRVAQGDTSTGLTLPAGCHFLSNGGTTIIDGGGTVSPGITVPAGAQQRILQAPMAGVTTLAPTPAGAEACTGVAAGATIAPEVQAFIGQFPFAATGAGQNFTFPNFKTHIREDYSQLRVDHTFSATDTMFARGTLDDAHMVTPYAASLISSDQGAGNPQADTQGVSRNQYYSVGENHIFSADLLNAFRFSFARTRFFAGFDELFSPLNPNFLLQDSTSTCPPACVWSYVPGELNGGIAPGGNVTAINVPGNTYPTYHTQNIFTFADDLFYTKGKHALKFGYLINHYQNNSLNSKGVYGAITYGSVANFMQGFAQSYSAVVAYPQYLEPGSTTLLGPPFSGNYLDRVNTYMTDGFYVQDDWRVKPRLTANLGVRYEFATLPHEIYGRYGTVASVENSDTFQIGSFFLTNATVKNISPRVGLAWDVFGNGKTAIRSGFGIYYDVGNIGQLLSSEGPNGMPPFGTQTQVSWPANTVLPFPLNLSEAASPQTFGKALQYTDPFYKDPKMMQWNVTVEQQLPGGIGLSVSYVGNRGIHIGDIMEGNPVLPASFVNGLPIYNVANGLAGCQNNALTLGTTYPFPSTETAAQTTAFGAGSPLPCRVNPYWTSALYATAAANSWYNGLQVVVTKRLSRGLQFSGSFTYDRAIDDTTGQAYGNDCAQGGSAIGQSPYNLGLDKAESCADVPLSMHLNLLYHFPTIGSNGFLSKFVNGWWMGNIVSVQDGEPATALISGERSFSGIATNANTDHSSLNTVANTNTIGGTSYSWIPFNAATVTTGNPLQWWNPLMFGQNPLGQLGNSPRDNLRMPGLGEWDFSVAKDTRLGFLGELGVLQFRAEIFNIINRANFGTPGATAFTANTSTNCPTANSFVGCNITAPNNSFGLITSTATNSRQIQLALKVVF